MYVTINALNATEPDVFSKPSLFQMFLAS